MNKHVEVNSLVGKTIVDVNRRNDLENEALEFTTSDGDVFRMMHDQDCCESVTIADICGDLNDLVGEPVMHASVESNRAEEWEDFESATWTFYKLATKKGWVTIRWLGESNGYYSEQVEFTQIKSGSVYQIKKVGDQDVYTITKKGLPMSMEQILKELRIQEAL